MLAVPIRTELIVVDDGSRDGTRDILSRLAAELRFKLVLQPANGGKGAALRRGFQEVTGDLVVIQDADLEYSPEEFPELIELICEGRADVVYGSRFLGRHRVFLFTHYAGNRFLTLVTNMLYNTMLTDMETCYKVMRTEVLRSMTLESNGFGIEPELTAKIFKRALPRLRSADHVRRPQLRRGEEDHLARRVRRVVGAAQIPVHRVNPLHRLFGYARPYRGRFAAAIAAMVVYAAATAAVAALIQPVIDHVLPAGHGPVPLVHRLLIVYVDQGARRVRVDLPHDRHRPAGRARPPRSAVPPHPRSVGDVLQPPHHRPADVADHQRRQPGPAGGLGDDRRPAARRAVAGRLRGVSVLLDARLALVAVTGAPLVVYPLVRFGKRIRSTTRRSQEQLEHLSHVTAEAFTGHRIVKAFGAEGREEARFRQASQRLYRTNLKVTQRAGAAAADDGVSRRRRGRRADLVRRARRSPRRR